MNRQKVRRWVTPAVHHQLLLYAFGGIIWKHILIFYSIALKVHWSSRWAIVEKYRYRGEKLDYSLNFVQWPPIMNFISVRNILSIILQFTVIHAQQDFCLASWSWFDILVNRYDGEHSLLRCTNCRGLLPTEYSECWPRPLFDILLNKYFPAGQPSDRQETPMHCSRECTPPDLFTGISNLLQPAQAEVELGQLSWLLASWLLPVSRQAG
jgi:hypothetical protein